MAETGSGGVLSTLGINWKLFIAQLVNFSILLFILWKYVFKPVASKLEQRTSKIEKSLNDAERIAKEKQEFAAWKEEEIYKTKIKAQGLITEAQTQALQEKEVLLKQTKEEQNKVVEVAKAQIEHEKNLAIFSAKAELANLVTTATEKILRKKLDEKTDKELIKETLKTI